MLRPSILYGCDMMFNLKESEIRQIERIEENYMRKVLDTTRGCPIVQMYLELGHCPARIEIQKNRLLFMQYILQESDECTLSRVFKLQEEEPTRGDWFSMCKTDLMELDIQESLEDIKNMNKNKFLQILKNKTKIRAFKYLIAKQGKKGKDIKYSNIEMAEYLLPYNEQLSIEEKRRLFSARNKMVNIRSNFSKTNVSIKCFCGQNENMEHLYRCKMTNIDEVELLPYEKIYSGTIGEQIQIFRKLEKNLELREEFSNEVPCDPAGSAAICSSIG